MALPVTAIAQPKETISLVFDTGTPLLSVNSPTIIPVELPPLVLCNCWNYVKKIFPSLPGTSFILSHLTTQGSVAVFYYPRQGLYHYAVVLYEMDGHYVIEETNYHSCQKSIRNISKGDTNLIGFFHIDS